MLGGLPCDGLVPPPEGRRNTLSSHPLSQAITQPSFVLYCLQELLECLFLFKIINFVTAKKSMNFFGQKCKHIGKYGIVVQSEISDVLLCFLSVYGN